MCESTSVQEMEQQNHLKREPLFLQNSGEALTLPAMRSRHQANPFGEEKLSYPGEWESSALPCRRQQRTSSGHRGRGTGPQERALSAAGSSPRPPPAYLSGPSARGVGVRPLLPTRALIRAPSRWKQRGAGITMLAGPPHRSPPEPVPVDSLCPFIPSFSHNSRKSITGQHPPASRLTFKKWQVVSGFLCFMPPSSSPSLDFRSCNSSLSL